MTTTTLPPPPVHDTTTDAAYRGSLISRVNRRAGSLLLRILLPVAIVIGWQLYAEAKESDFIPTPGKVFARVVGDYLTTSPRHLFLGPETWAQVVPSLLRTLEGWLLAAVVGIAVGLALGCLPRFLAATMPLLHLARSLPTPALLGVFFFLFGTGDLPKVLLIAFGCVWPVLLNAVDGAQSVGAVRADVAQIFRLRTRDCVFRILLPAASPKIFAGLRTSLSYALILMIITELQKAVNGLGYQLNLTQRNYDYIGFWAVLVVLAILGLALNLCLSGVEHPLLRWHNRMAANHE